MIYLLMGIIGNQNIVLLLIIIHLGINLQVHLEKMEQEFPDYLLGGNTNLGKILIGYNDFLDVYNLKIEIFNEQHNFKTNMDKVFEQILRDTLTEYENKTGKMFVVTFKEVGESCNPTEIGRPEERKCRWKVEIGTTRKKFWCEQVTSWDGKVSQKKIDADCKANEESVPTEPELLFLNGIYDSIVDIENKITELQLTNAVELYEDGGGDLESFKKIGKNNNGRTIWELTCGVCKNTTGINCLCQTRGCCN